MLGCPTLPMRRVKITSSFSQLTSAQCIPTASKRVRRSEQVIHCPGCCTSGRLDALRQPRQSRNESCRCSAVASPSGSTDDEHLHAKSRQQEQQQSVPQWILSVRRAPSVQVLCSRLARMKSLNDAPLIHCSIVKLAHLIRYQGGAIVHRRAVKQLSKQLILAAKAVGTQLTPRATVDILWCSTYIPYKDPVLVHQLVSSLYGKLDLLPQASLFKLITSLAKFRYPLTRSWMDNFIAALSPSWPSFSPEQLAALMLACKELKYVLPDAVLETCCTQTMHHLPSCKPATLGVILASLPATYQPNAAWQQAFLAAVQSKLHATKPKELAQILSGLPHLKCKCSDTLLLELLSECLEQLQAFSAHELVVIISGLAALRVKPDSTWLQAFMFQTKGRLPDFLASELAALVKSLARLGHKPSPAWIQAVCQQAESGLVFAGPGEAASLLHGLARIGYKPEQGFISRFLQHTRFKLCLLEAGEAVELFAALGGLQFPVNASWCSELFYHTEPLLGSLTPGMLVELVAGLAAWQVCPPTVWQSSLATALTAQLHRFRDPQRVSLITNLRKLSRSDAQLEPILAAVITQLWEHTEPHVTYHLPNTAMIPGGSSPSRGSSQSGGSPGRGLDTLRFGSTSFGQSLSTAAPNPYVLIRL